MNNDRTVYRLAVEDIQNVANELLGGKLTEKEVEKVEIKLGNLIPWHDAIENAIIFSDIKKKKK
jgi:hypothetical protein